MSNLAPSSVLVLLKGKLSPLLRGIYGHTDTTRHYTEARFRHQAQDMLLVAVSVRPTETFL